MQRTTRLARSAGLLSLVVMNDARSDIAALSTFLIAVVHFNRLKNSLKSGGSLTIGVGLHSQLFKDVQALLHAH